MAIAGTTVWEIRPTVGSDTNGGGFDPGISGAGTDFSVQNSKNTVGNNISTTDAGVSGTTLTSATAAFTSAIKGNIIYLTGGGATTGWYEVTGYTNATTITLDRGPGAATNATMNIGGALTTVLSVLGTSIPFVAGNTIWIKNTGSMVVTSVMSLNSTIVGMIFEGYGTTRGDNTQVTWTTATNSTRLINFAGATTISFFNIYFSNTASTRADGFHATGSSTANIFVHNCVFDGFVDGINGDYSVDYQFINLYVVRTEIKNCSSSGIVQSGNTYLLACYVHACTTYGVYTNDLQGQVTLDINMSVIASNGNGLYMASDQNLILSIKNNVFYNNTNAGMSKGSAGGGGLQFLWNNIFYSNGTYGIDYVTYGVGSMQPDNHSNAFGANGTAARRGYTFGSGSDITLSADPFNNESTDDYSLNSTSGGGAACKGAGYQGTLNGAVGGATSASIDVGAVQSAGGGSSITNYIVSKNVTKVFVNE